MSLLEYLLLISCGKEEHVLFPNKYIYESTFVSDLDFHAQDSDGFDHFDALGKYKDIEEFYKNDFIKEGEGFLKFDFIDVIDESSIDLALTDNEVQVVNSLPYELNGTRLIISKDLLELEYDKGDGTIHMCFQIYSKIKTILISDSPGTCIDEPVNEKLERLKGVMQ